jgi:hypothetical protein
MGGGVPDAEPAGGVPDGAGPVAAGGNVERGGVPGGVPESAGPAAAGGGAGAAQEEAQLLAGGAPDGVMPSHRTHVWPWLKGPCQRFMLPTWLAITIYHDIFSWRKLDDFELAHELCHVRQWNANGMMYVPRYLGASRAAKAAGKDRYRDNAFEVEAYDCEDALRVARAGPHPA